MWLLLVEYPSSLITVPTFREGNWGQKYAQQNILMILKHTVNGAARYVVSEGEDLIQGPKTVSVTQSFV